MLQATIHHDLTQYKAKAAFGLSLRSVIWLACGASAAVAMGCYCGFVLGIEVGSFASMCLIFPVCAPFFAMVFVKPDGMSLEEWLPLWVRHHLTNRRVFYSVNAPDREAERQARLNRETKAQAKFRTTQGIERALHSDDQVL